MNQIICDNCQKKFDRKSFCSDTCRIDFHNKRRPKKSDPEPPEPKESKKKRSYVQWN